MRHVSLIVLLVAAVLGAASCDDIIGFVTPGSAKDVIVDPHPGDGTLVLGSSFSIIHTTANVTEALRAAGYGTTPRTTAYYVKFTPQAGLQLLSLIDKGVHLSEVPFDRNITTLGTWYREPSLSDYAPTSQYAVIPASEWDALKGSLLVPYEVLAEVCLPEQGEEAAAGVSQDRYDGALDSWCGKKGYGDDLRESGGWWVPEGTVAAWDSTAMRMVPVKGAEVEIRHLLRVRYATTDENGRFRAPGAFRGKVSCRVYWRSGGSAGWSVRAGGSQAFFEVPEAFVSGSSCDIAVPGGNTHAAHHSLMYRAAYRAFEEGGLGMSLNMKGRLGRPLFLSYVHGTLDHGEGVTTFPNANPGVVPEVRIGGQSLGEWMPQDKFFCVTVHELGHVAHYLAAGSDYLLTDSIVKESWAQFVRYFLGEAEYRSLGAMPAFIGTWYAKPYWTYVDTDGRQKTAWNGATPEMLAAAGVSPRHYWGEEVKDGAGKTVKIFDNPFNGKSMQTYHPEDFLVDFYDDMDQSLYFEGSGTSHDGKKPDTVSGYTVIELRDIVWKSHTANDLHTYLVGAASSHGATAADIDAIFENYGISFE